MDGVTVHCKDLPMIYFKDAETIIHFHLIFSIKATPALIKKTQTGSMYCSEIVFYTFSFVKHFFTLIRKVLYK